MIWVESRPKKEDKFGSEKVRYKNRSYTCFGIGVLLQMTLKHLQMFDVWDDIPRVRGLPFRYGCLKSWI